MPGFDRELTDAGRSGAERLSGKEFRRVAAAGLSRNLLSLPSRFRNAEDLIESTS